MSIDDIKPLQCNSKSNRINCCSQMLTIWLLAYWGFFWRSSEAANHLISIDKNPVDTFSIFHCDRMNAWMLNALWPITSMNLETISFLRQCDKREFSPKNGTLDHKLVVVTALKASQYEVYSRRHAEEWESLWFERHFVKPYETTE